MKYVQEVSKSNANYLDQAIELAKMSEHNFKHGAVIRKAGKTIAVGINHTINDPAMLGDALALTNAAVHAEVAALNACRKVDLNGAVIYIARVNKRDEPRMSKPCIRCQKALKERGVKKVYYTVENEMTL